MSFQLPSESNHPEAETEASGRRPLLRSPWRRARPVLGVGIVLALFMAAGCGGDDDDSARDKDTETGSARQATTTTTEDAAAYCTAELATETAGEPDIDFVNMTAEEQAEAVSTFSSETLLPKVAQVERVLPDELEDEYATLSAALEQVAAGNLVAATTPEVTAATETVHAYDLEHCGWESRLVTTSEYSFEGLPSTLPAGVTSFEVTNDGSELHEMALLRKNDGVSQSFEEILAMPQEQALELVTQLGQAGPIASGEDDSLTADLTPGDYLALCFVPTGTMTVDAPGQGPPHFLQGMVSEFTVA